MHRQPLLALISEYQARYPGESAMISRLESFVSAHRDCFERSLLAGHVTGSAWLLDRACERVLLTHHRKLNIWVQPGGHADGNADVFDVAMREATEESGIDGLIAFHNQLFDVDIHAIPARADEPEHYHYDCRFAFRATDSDDYRVSEESHDLRWVPLDEIAELTSEESVLRMVEKTATLIGTRP